MRSSGIIPLLASASLAIAALAASSPTATAQADTEQCVKIYSTQISGTLYKCTWDDGRIRVLGTMHDPELDNGATLLTVNIGTYSRKWLVCATDTPVDTDYQPGGVVYVTYKSASTEGC
ncbi:hypothetical protein [Streptomyces achromogenes]|uniref:hypothetical protein n=1 Tax=Streptomyces achromogenes TaxID=67255 RepID=UPI0036F768AE